MFRRQTLTRQITGTRRTRPSQLVAINAVPSTEPMVRFRLLIKSLRNDRRVLTGDSHSLQRTIGPGFLSIPQPRTRLLQQNSCLRSLWIFRLHASKQHRCYKSRNTASCPNFTPNTRTKAPQRAETSPFLRTLTVHASQVAMLLIRHDSAPSTRDRTNCSGTKHLKV